MLVVDDDLTVRSLIVEILIDEGYAVREASDGREALATMAGWRPEVVVLDLVMRGMDGRAFLREQRGRPELASIPVIVLSARYRAQLDATELGADAVVLKPFELDELAAEVQRQLIRNASFGQATE